MSPTPIVIVIVGAGPAGLTCARTYRDCGGDRPVRLIGDDPEPPYERPALTKALLRGETTSEAIVVAGRDELAANGIELTTGARVVDADPRERTVTLDDGTSQPYAELVLATGARAKVPDIDGATLAHTVRRGGAYTAHYGRDGTLVGVLTHEADEVYERGRGQVAEGVRWP